MLPAIHDLTEVPENTFVEPKVKIPTHFVDNSRWADIKMDASGCHPQLLVWLID